MSLIAVAAACSPQEADVSETQAKLTAAPPPTCPAGYNGIVGSEGDDHLVGRTKPIVEGPYSSDAALTRSAGLRFPAFTRSRSSLPTLKKARRLGLT